MKAYEHIAEQLAAARSEGSEEAWEFVKSICNDDGAINDWYIAEISKTGDGLYTRYAHYAEAKAAFEAWKAEQRWEPKVGDVVSYHNRRYVIMKLYSDAIQMYSTDTGTAIIPQGRRELSYTGEHVDLSELFKVLEG